MTVFDILFIAIMSLCLISLIVTEWRRHRLQVKQVEKSLKKMEEEISAYEAQVANTPAMDVQRKQYQQFKENELKQQFSDNPDPPN
jgi:hypothetical protein